MPPPAANNATGRRLDNPRDLVRSEIRTALDRGLFVVPVLVGGAGMPPVEQLPDELKVLAAHNACELSDARWKDDVERLVVMLESKAGCAAGVDPRFSAGLDALKRGHYKDAVNLLTLVIDERPTAEALYHRGLASFLHDTRDVDERTAAALEDWNRAIVMAPEWAMAYRQRANAFATIRKWSQALADYDRAIQLEPHEPRAFFNRAMLRRSSNDVAGAIADLEHVLDLQADAVLEREAESQLQDLRARYSPRQRS